jgi:hypothetical protein
MFEVIVLSLVVAALIVTGLVTYALFCGMAVRPLAIYAVQLVHPRNLIQGFHAALRHVHGNAHKAYVSERMKLWHSVDPMSNPFAGPLSRLP